MITAGELGCYHSMACCMLTWATVHKALNSATHQAQRSTAPLHSAVCCRPQQLRAAQQQLPHTRGVCCCCCCCCCCCSLTVAVAAAAVSWLLHVRACVDLLKQQHHLRQHTHHNIGAKPQACSCYCCCCCWESRTGTTHVSRSPEWGRQLLKHTHVQQV